MAQIVTADLVFELKNREHGITSPFLVPSCRYGPARCHCRLVVCLASLIELVVRRPLVNVLTPP